MTVTLEEIPARFAELRDRVAHAAEAVGRHRDDVLVELAVKYQSPERQLAALRTGASLFGHNLIQQLEESEKALRELQAPPHRTHVIGHVQSNKLRKAVRFSHCLETLDSLAIAQKVNSLVEQLRSEGVRNEPYDVMIQVNSSGAPTQFGVEPGKVEALAEAIADLPHLRLIGLMTIGAHSEDQRLIARSFSTVRELAEGLRERGHSELRELSMGMSGDLDIAIAEGSTIVRVGSAVFGAREQK